MFARTERLLLRPGWVDDAGALARAIAHETIVRNLSSVPWPYGAKDADDYLAQVQIANLPSFLIFARTQRQPELVGGIGLHANPNNRFDLPELGYWIAQSHWGKGYATEAGHSVLNLARDTLKCRKIAAGYFTDNPASGAVLRKLGFTLTGKIETRYSKARNADVPMVLASIDLENGTNNHIEPPPLTTAGERWAA